MDLAEQRSADSEVRGVSVESALRLQAPAPVRGTGAQAAAAALAAAALLLWVWAPVGLVVAVVAGWVCAPWGRRLGERLMISAVVTCGSAAAVLAAAAAAEVSVPLPAWRVLATAALLGVAVARLRDRAGRLGPALPACGWDDAVAVGTGGALAALLATPHLLVPLSRSLTGLFDGWDHSSHLVMYVQTMRAGGWDVSSLGGDVMFSVYPMLHTGLWSIGEWISGAGTSVTALGLVRSYVVWSSLTAGLAATLTVASAAVAARALARGWRRAPVVAAGITASWFLLGTPALMADFAFSNFLLAAALTSAAVVVATRTRSAMATLGWFVLPLGVVAVAYAYPPLAGGIVVAALITLVAVWQRSGPRAALPLVLVGAVCAAATLPAVRIVVEPFQGRAVGDIQGGIPQSEYLVGLLLAVGVVVWLLRGMRGDALAVRLALAAPIAVTALVAAVFAMQAVALSLPLHESYYTKKVVYAVLLLSLPLAAALLMRVVPRWTTSASPQRAGGVVLAAGAATLAVASILTAGSRPGVDLSLASALPPGAWSLVQRVEAVAADDVEGRALIIASRTRPDWVAVTLMDDHEVQAGRTAAGLAGVLSWRDNEVIELAHSDLDALRALMVGDPGLRVRFVVTEPARAQGLAPFESLFGPDRVQVDLVGR